MYHCSIKVFSRGKGKSAVAAAAYRAGEKQAVFNLNSIRKLVLNVLKIFEARKNK